MAGLFGGANSKLSVDPNDPTLRCPTEDDDDDEGGSVEELNDEDDVGRGVLQSVERAL